MHQARVRIGLRPARPTFRSAYVRDDVHLPGHDCAGGSLEPEPLCRADFGIVAIAGLIELEILAT